MKIIRLLAFVVAVLGVASVTLANRSIDESFALKQIETETNLLRREVAVKRSEVAEAGSLLTLSQLAKEAGYSENVKITSVDLPAVTASR